MDDIQEAMGTVWAVFGHRFAIEGQGGRLLADLGPKAAERIALKVGDTVTLKGERKPSEIKVTSLTLPDGSVRTIDWPKKRRSDGMDDKAPADPAVAVAAVRAEGYAVEGEPKRKLKHFELVGIKDGTRHEFHVERDGRIRKTKPLVA